MDLTNFVVCINAVHPSYVVTWVTHLFLLLTFHNRPRLTSDPTSSQGWCGDLRQAAAPETRRWRADDGNAKRGSRVRHLLLCTPPLTPPLILFLPVSKDFFVPHPFYLFLYDHKVSLHDNNTGFIYLFPSNADLTSTLMWILSLFALLYSVWFYVFLWVVFIYFLPSMIFVWYFFKLYFSRLK